MKQYNLIVIGVSAGGMGALSKLLPIFNKDCKLSIVIVQHRARSKNNYFIEHFHKLCPMPVQEAVSLMKIESNNIYFAPAGYHLLIEKDKTFSLSCDEKVKHSRPSIDVLFESAADVYRENLIGLILTGANDDGADGIRKIKQNGGLTIVQDPDEAEYPIMPESTIKKTQVDYIVKIDDINKILNTYYD